MSDTHLLLTRGATSLTLMLMGFDTQLDERLLVLRDLLRQKDFSLEQFQQQMADVESVYDLLEQGHDNNIELYIESFKLLFSGSPPEIMAPLNSLQPVLSDLLSFAQPLADFVRRQAASETGGIVLDGPVQKDHYPSGTELNALRLRLAGRFKALLQSLAAMGNDPRGPEGPEGPEGPDSNDNWQALDKLARKTLDLMHGRLTEQQRAFVGYLTELDTRLTHINKIVTSDSQTLGELRTLNGLFNIRINQQMIEVKTQVGDQTRVEALKRELLGSLEQITHRLVEYQDSFTSKLDHLETNSNQMASTIQALEKENQELQGKVMRERNLSMLDTLTQLPNRLGFNNRLESELSRASRYRHPISVAIIDIDLFKRINDEFGHVVGDKVLRVIAIEMKRVCREHDYLARYGGEEFILLLPQTPLPDAHIAVEKIRHRVAHCRFHFHNKPVPITISAGVSQWRPGEITDDWIERADMALYSGKQNGRNRVISAAD
ncbi:MAG: diguanylate cyclase [Reinekea sp.]|jgi:diguanylate cyclase